MVAVAVFFFIADHEKGFKFHAQSQTAAYSCYNFSDRKTKIKLSLTLKYHLIQQQIEYNII